VVALTFDDGYATDISRALPCLEQRSVPATFFVVPAWVGQPGYLHWDQVRALAQAGMAIGSHSLTHACLPELPAGELRYELAVSRQLLQDQLGAPVSLLSVPGGFYSRRVLETAWDVGYTIVATSDCGIERPAGSAQPRRWVVKRNGIDLRTSWDALEMLLRARVPARLLLKERSKRFAARLLGPSRYGRLAPRRRRLDPPSSRP
jgi:peptidoglycan/xylan/chitin deacetylase (PgdA/CDA1 family)